VRDVAIARMLDMIKEDLGALNIHHEVFFSERSLTAGGKDEVRATIQELAAKGLV
jgi:arginyl-tRNA synthetase